MKGPHGWRPPHLPPTHTVCPYSRNVKDQIPQMLKANNSLTVVNNSPESIPYVNKGNKGGLPVEDPALVTLDGVMEVILHIGNLSRVDRVGIGTDINGIASLSKGFENVLLAASLQAGASHLDAAKIAGGNVLHV